MKLERLDWDSTFFNYNVGRIIVNENQYINLSEFLLDSKEYKLVYIFSKLSLHNELFKLVDEKVVLHQELSSINRNLPSDFFTIKSFDKLIHNRQELEKLALESGTYSRFNIDENFKSGEYNKLYLTWIALSIEEKLAFDIIIATDKNETIVGFVTLNKKSESLVNIGLVAVSDGFRGKGIGKSLINYALNKSFELGYKEIQVITQINNINAIKLYESIGFYIKEKTFVYHYWNL
jgi:dTDP-4-amino-4,6-dideoxy-D-galactose acyltransferase